MDLVHKISFKRILALFLVFILIICESNIFIGAFASEPIEAVQVETGNSSIMIMSDDNSGYEPINIPVYVGVQGGTSGNPIYSISPKNQLTENAIFNEFVKYSDYGYSLNWAEGIRTILDNSYPNVSYQFGTTNREEAYAAAQLAIYIWSAHTSNSDAYPNALKNILNTYSIQTLREKARTGLINDYIITHSLSGKRILTSAMELVNLAYNEPSKHELKIVNSTAIASNNMSKYSTVMQFIANGIDSYTVLLDKFPADVKVTDVKTNTLIDAGDSSDGNIISFSFDKSMELKIESEQYIADHAYLGYVDVYGTGLSALDNIKVADGNAKVLTYTNESVLIDTQDISVEYLSAMGDQFVSSSAFDYWGNDAISSIDYFENISTGRQYNIDILGQNQMEKGTYKAVLVDEATSEIVSGDKYFSVGNTERNLEYVIRHDINASNNQKITLNISATVHASKEASYGLNFTSGIYSIITNNPIKVFNGTTFKEYNAGEEVERIYVSNSLSEATVTSKLLPVGSYSVKQIQSPHGLSNIGGDYLVEITTDGGAAYINNELLSTEFELEYIDSDFNPVEGKALTITKVEPVYSKYKDATSTPASHNMLDATYLEPINVVTDANGKINTSLYYGTYYVSPTNSVAGGNDDIAPFYIFVNTDDKIVKQIKPAVYTGRIEFQLKEMTSATGEDLSKANVEILLEDVNNLQAEPKKATTNASGWAFIDNVGVGSYKIKLNNVPDGYTYSEISMDLTLADLKPDGSTVIEKELGLEPINGRLTITKTGSVYSSVDRNIYGEKYYTDSTTLGKGLTIYSQNFENKPLVGAKISVYYAEDVYENGNKIHSKDELATSFTSTDEPYVINNLMPAKYKIIETEAPAGYLLDGQIYLVDFTDDSTTSVIMKSQNIENTLKHTELLSNIAVSNKGVDVPGNYTSDFIIGVFTDQQFVTPGAAYSRDSLVYVLKSGEKAVLPLQPGKYYLKQLGFTETGHNKENLKEVSINTEKVPFVVGDECWDNIKKVYTPNISTITNSSSKVEVPVKIVTIQASGVEKELFGVELGIYNLSDELLMSGTSNEENPLKFELAPGKYFLKQLSNVPGYKKADKILFTVNFDGTVSPETKLIVERASASITNLDKDGVGIQNSSFEVTKPDGAAITVSTNDKGIAELNSLDVGKYLIKQKTVGNGGQKTDAVLEFNVQNDGSITGSTVVYNYTYGVTIKKYEKDTRALLSGAHIGVYKESDPDTLLFYGISDSNGEIYFNNLEVGKYILKELKAPSGYIGTSIPNNIEIKDGENTISEFINDSIGIGIRNIETSTNNGIANSQIRVYKDAYSKVFTSDSRGVFNLSELTEGTYSYVQTSVPVGYVLNNTVYTFTINPDRSITGDIEFENEAMNFEIVVKSKDNDAVENAELTVEFNGVNTSVKTNSQGIAVIAISGVGTYKIKMANPADGYIENTTILSVVVSPDGSISGDKEFILTPTVVKFHKVDEDNKPMEGVIFSTVKGEDILNTYTTDENGNAFIYGLSVGVEYAIVETDTLDGYALPSAPIKFKLTNDGKIEGEADNVFSLKNYIIKVNCVGKGSDGKKLAGAAVNIYNDDNSFNQIFEFDSNGEFSIKGLLPGTYKIKQTKTINGYYIDNDEHSFTVDKYGNVTGVTEIRNQKISSSGGSGSGGSSSGSSSSNRGSIVIYVHDTNNDAIKDVKITFYKNGNKLYTKTTDKYGEIRLYNLSNGTYTYKEISVPDEFILNENEYSFKIKNNKNEGTASILNYRKNEDSVKLIRKDTLGSFISGSVMEVKNTSTKKVITVTTDGNGEAGLKNLPAGTYSVKETKAAPGYLLDKTEYTFKLDEEYKTSGSTVYTSDIIRVAARVIDNYNKGVYGAQFGLFTSASANNPAYTATSAQDGSLEFKKVIPGTYTLKQISAPNKYTVSTSTFMPSITDSYVGDINQYIFLNTYDGPDGTQPKGPGDTTGNNTGGNGNDNTAIGGGTDVNGQGAGYVITDPDNPNYVTPNGNNGNNASGQGNGINQNGVGNEVESANGGNGQAPGGHTTTPKTDDNSMVPFMVVVMCISCLGAVLMIMKLRKFD